MKTNTEARAPYAVGTPPPEPAERDEQDRIIAAALAILDARARKPGATLTSPRAVRDWLTLNIGNKEREEFWAVWLDAQNRLIIQQRIATGTLTQCSVFPREVLKGALSVNAAAVIFAHNHPSGHPEPSHADETLTHALKEALALVDVRVLDHFVIAGSAAVSFAERGLI